ncbi:MAG: dTDP-4-dehydrorhamnose reductase [Candidatus Rokubacteria bacterium]|nr:dTDP-4-dehydrorhamnose reductase [Candidatus Rokubacteria bacterium]
MRALVIGASGQVGAALSARLTDRQHEVVGTHSRVPQPGTRLLDLTAAAATERLIAETEPDWVFCPAGLTLVDYCEDHPDEAFRVNRDAPAVAAREAARHGAGFVYYSTEYVFDGKSGPYAEDDPVHAVSVYGQSKLGGERLALEANPRALVIRTTVVYGPEPQGKNFVYQLLRRARAGERMTVPADQRSSPTYNADLAAATVELAERGHAGVLHVAGVEVLDRYAFARLACEVFELDPGFLTPVTTAALGQRAARPLMAGLRVDRARAILATPLRPPRAGLGAMRRALDGASIDTPSTGPVR